MCNEKNLSFTIPEVLTQEITEVISTIKSEGLAKFLDAASFLKNTLPDEVTKALESIGHQSARHNSIVIHGLFDSDNPDVAMTVHESISRYLCGINDIQYRYEEHKLIYPKEEGQQFSEWGNGIGDISPHSDDLYENIDSDLLSLTVVRDNTACPTLIYNTEDIIEQMSDESVELLRTVPVRYSSGRNVVGERIERIRPVIEQDKGDVLYNIDLRIEKNHGDRMVAVDVRHQPVLDELRLNIDNADPVSADGKTGTFVVINNRKVLHSRARIPSDKTFLQPEKSDRLLYRSKGQKASVRPMNVPD